MLGRTLLVNLVTLVQLKVGLRFDGLTVAVKVAVSPLVTESGPTRVSFMLEGGNTENTGSTGPALL